MFLQRRALSIPNAEALNPHLALNCILALYQIALYCAGLVAVTGDRHFDSFSDRSRVVNRGGVRQISCRDNI